MCRGSDLSESNIMATLHQDKDVSERQQRNTVLIRPRSWVRDNTECILDRTYKIPEKES